MATLSELNERWIVKQQELVRALGRDLAGPFLGYTPPCFAGSAKRVLYVGKATENAFRADDTLPITADGQLSLAQEVFSSARLKNNPATFWGFAKEVSRVLGRTDLGNLSWANICRVGETAGTPKPDLMELQHELALETLRAELSELKPTVVLFVCHHDGDRLIRELIDDAEDKTWSRSEDFEGKPNDIWCRKPNENLPGMIWAPHPQFMKPEVRNFVIDRVRELA